MSHTSVTDAAERRVAVLLNAAVDFASRSIHLPRMVKRMVVAGLDAVFAIIAVWIALTLRLGELVVVEAALFAFTAAMLAFWYPIALYRGVYSAIFRFSGRGAIASLSVSVTLLTIPLILLFMVFQQPGIPRTMAILGPIVFFLLICLSRIVGRYVLVDLFNTHNGAASFKRVLIYGAGATGQRLAGSLAVEAGMRVAGYLDDDRSKRGQLLDGVRVYHSSQVADLIKRRGVTDVVIAISNVSYGRRKAIISALEPLSINVQTLPPIRHLMEGRISADSLRPIEVKDLLGRPVVPEHQDLLHQEIAGKLVMVTGAGGSIGSEICRQVLAQQPSGLVMIDANEYALFKIGQELEAALLRSASAFRPRIYQRLADVSNPAAIGRLFEEFAPETVFHAAAYKHVPLVEDNVIEAVRNNVMGTRLMAQAALGCGAHRFVLISTDKAVRPPNVMGASKRLCEIILQDYTARQSRANPGRGQTVFSMVRFGNVLGSSGSVVPIFQQQIEKGGPVTVTHREVTRYFMTIFEAAQLVIQAGAMAKGGEVFLLDMGQPVRIWDLAHSMVRLAGLTVRDDTNPNGDIEIMELGLRPGEKLYEELLIGETSSQTEHPRIMQGSEICPSPLTVATVLRELEEAIARNDVAGCKAALKTVVPSLRHETQAPLRKRSRQRARPALHASGPRARLN